MAEEIVGSIPRTGETSVSHDAEFSGTLIMAVTSRAFRSIRSSVDHLKIRG
jgi:hypothetical protein